MLVWEKLLNNNRRKPKKGDEPKKQIIKEKEARTETERDYDRILFSTPVRRLQDKTQVFPLERNDSTRLTHSHGPTGSEQLLLIFESTNIKAILP